MEFDDIGPDENMDLTDGVRVPAGSPGATALAVPFTGEQLHLLGEIAKERGINSIEAVQRLVEEGLKARAQQTAA